MILKKKMTINKALELVPALRNLINLGFKNNDLSFEIAIVCAKIQDKLTEFNILKKSCIDNMNKEIKELVNPTRMDKDLKENKEYQKSLEKYNKQKNEISVKYNNKLTNIGEKEIEIEYKEISYKFLKENVEKVIQPNIFLSLNWLIKNEK